MAKKFIITKSSDGVLIPACKDAEATIAKWRTGESYTLTYQKARSPQHHRLIFAIANAVIDNAPEDSYWNGKDACHFIKSVMLSMGIVDEVMDLNGEVHLIPKSLSFENMDENEFRPIADRVLLEAARILDLTQTELLQNIGVAA